MIFPVTLKNLEVKSDSTTLKSLHLPPLPLTINKREMSQHNIKSFNIKKNVNIVLSFYNIMQDILTIHFSNNFVP
jgi:hypothetical protein